MILKHRILNFKGRLVHLYFLASLSNDVLISRLVEGIENREGKDLENCINMGDVEIVSTNQIQKIQRAVLGGNSALFDGEITYLMDTKNFSKSCYSRTRNRKKCPWS